MGAAVALAITLAAPEAAAAAPAGCANQQAPPPPAAREEIGKPVPEPLPWPPNPVGGDPLGSCGDIGPAGLPQVGAASWIVADLDSGAVLAAHAPHARHRPASTLKVLNALVVRRELSPDAVVDGAAEDVAIDGSKAGIGPGGHYTVRELLDGLLLNSGNDAAQALARTLGGDAAMVRDMSDLAHQLGALDTRPATPSGLDGPGMASSAYDLALLFRVAMRDQLFAETIGSRVGALPRLRRPARLRVEQQQQAACSTTAGRSAARPGSPTRPGTPWSARPSGDGRRLVVALMRGEQEPVPMWQQAAALLDWGFAQPTGAPTYGVLVDAAPAPADHRGRGRPGSAGRRPAARWARPACPSSCSR